MRSRPVFDRKDKDGAIAKNPGPAVVKITYPALTRNHLGFNAT